MKQKVEHGLSTDRQDIAFSQPITKRKEIEILKQRPSVGEPSRGVRGISISFFLCHRFLIKAMSCRDFGLSHHNFYFITCFALLIRNNSCAC